MSKIIVVSRLGIILLLLARACTKAYGQDCIAYDSDAASRLLKNKVLIDDTWMEISDSSGKLAFSSKKEVQELLVIKAIPVMHLDYKKFASCEINKATRQYYIADSYYKIGFIEVHDSLFCVSLQPSPYDEAGEAIIENYVPKEIKVMANACNVFYDSFFKTYAYFSNDEVYLFDSQKKFISFREMIPDINGLKNYMLKL